MINVSEQPDTSIVTVQENLCGEKQGPRIYGGKGVGCCCSMNKNQGKWWDRKFKIKESEGRRQDISARQGPDADSVQVRVQSLGGGGSIKKEKNQNQRTRKTGEA